MISFLERSFLSVIPVTWILMLPHPSKIGMKLRLWAWWWTDDPRSYQTPDFLEHRSNGATLMGRKVNTHLWIDSQCVTETDTHNLRSKAIFHYCHGHPAHRSCKILRYLDLDSLLSLFTWTFTKNVLSLPHINTCIIGSAVILKQQIQ